MVTSGTTVAAGNAKDFSPCSDCFPEKVLVTNREYRNVKCYGLAACVVLLVGFSLGSLATLCGMTMDPGTYNVGVKPWQALGYNKKKKVKEELALGDGRTFKEVSRGRKEHEESDESELMAVWTSRSRKPNTHYEHYEFYLRNYNVCTGTADDTNANTIRNRNAYTIKDYVKIGKVMLPYVLLCANHVLSEFYNVFDVIGEYYKEETGNGAQYTENQESESLEPGYAP